MKKLLLLTTIILTAYCSYAQNLELGEIHGNFQIDAQNYFEDSLIGAEKVPEKIRSNAFANINYTRGNFKAGLRYESYQKPLLGFDARYEGSGVTYKYAGYETEDFEFTVGNFYEQFGSGLILRAYEERQLGIDNAFDGVRMKYRPVKGVYLKGLIGKQRFFFETGPAIVRGFDGEVNLNEALPNMNGTTTYIIGGSVVSKYQADEDPIKILPENVASFAGRFNLITPKFNFYTEYAYKINDPSLTNNYIYKNGEALFATVNYSVKGFSATLSGKRIDNMDFRSDRNADGNNLTISFLPAVSKQHTYALPAFYPYATQPLGEIGFQAEVAYNFKKGTTLGGEYGTLVTINYSKVNNLDTTQLNNEQGYSSEYLALGKTLLYEDINVEIAKKFSSKWKGTFTYMYQVFNKDRVQNVSGYGTIYSHISVVEIGYKITPKHNIRVEGQSLYTKQDEGSWAMALAEYTVSPHWFFALIDQYNYGNEEAEKQIHYFSGSLGYTRNATRIALGYGKQREGYLCVGGVCRLIPASYGVSLSVSSSF
jgi:hypothetical protein